MSRYSKVLQGPPIEVFALNKAYTEDTYEKKVNLGVGGEENRFILFFYATVSLLIAKTVFSLSN